MSENKYIVTVFESTADASSHDQYTSSIDFEFDNINDAVDFIKTTVEKHNHGVVFGKDS